MRLVGKSGLSPAAESRGQGVLVAGGQGFLRVAVVPVVAGRACS